jgi:Sulfatase/C-terminal region of aryl-sulfatase
MKTLLLNPPSFPNFDGGASSRWPATREIASHWYPVWLSYPAGLIKDCRLLDASPHKITSEATIGIAKTYDFVAIYTSTPGWRNDVRLAEMMKAAKPDLKIAFVGPPVTSQPDAALKASESIDFVIRKEIDYPLAEFAEGKPRTAGGPTIEEFKINGEYVDTPEQKVVGIPFLDKYVERASIDYLDKAAKSDKPFFMSINFMKVHQPNMPAPEFEGKSISKSKYADSLVENDTRIGRIMDKIRALGLDKNTYVFWTTDNGAWQDVYPDAGYTPFRGTKGTVREGGSRVPAYAWGPGIKPGTKNHDILGGLDYMATFASLAGVKLPEKDRAGEPIIFDSYDMSPVLFGKGKSVRDSWFYFTENELSPGAFRWHQFKFTFNLRGDDGQATGGLSVDSNLGWKGPEKYVAGAPQLFDLLADPQERYDILMNSFTENTWAAPIMGEAVKKLMESYIKYPPRKLQSDGYTGPITITNFQKFQWLREQLAKDGFSLGLPGQ